MEDGAFVTSPLSHHPIDLAISHKPLAIQPSAISYQPSTIAISH
jgi:hypothetical protein